ncbi:MAG: Denitrification system component NirT [Betaproteobacteria bacterium PRO3]|nr:Denitrification system component NirT [Betaproteobacteria bacterium PRO3]
MTGSNEGGGEDSGGGGALSRLWTWLRRPSGTISVLSLLAVGTAAGIVVWGGFNTVVEATNTETFCISCHEMRDNVYAEYKQTIHYSNRTGVRAVCADCHVPRDWTHKMIRKVQATKELYGKVMGTIDTKEKFEAKRLELARSEWKRMKAADSRECRNCHGFESMNTEAQKPRAKKAHELGQRDGQTCIDCHKGIAHRKPQGMTEEDEG